MTEEMIEAACEALVFGHEGRWHDDTGVSGDHMRVALEAALPLLPDSERVKELQAEVAKWQKLAGENFHHSADIEKERFTLSAKLDSAEAREQALIVANGKAEEERIAADEALAESQGREAMLVEALNELGHWLSYAGNQHDEVDKKPLQERIDAALSLTPPSAEAHNARIRRETLEEAAAIAENVGQPVGAGDGCGTRIVGTSSEAAQAIRAALAMEGE